MVGYIRFGGEEFVVYLSYLIISSDTSIYKLDALVIDKICRICCLNVPYWKTWDRSGHPLKNWRTNKIRKMLWGIKTQEWYSSLLRFLYIQKICMRYQLRKLLNKWGIDVFSFSFFSLFVIWKAINLIEKNIFQKIFFL